MKKKSTNTICLWDNKSEPKQKEMQSWYFMISWGWMVDQVSFPFSDHGVIKWLLWFKISFFFFFVFGFLFFVFVFFLNTETQKQALGVGCKTISIENTTGRNKMGNLTHVPSGRQSLGRKRQISPKCLIYRKVIELELSQMRSWSEFVPSQAWEVWPEAWAGGD